MASSNKTENYGLNQWVKSDPVLMDDMNADNKKIDAAMKGLAEQLSSGLSDLGHSGKNVRMAFGSYVGTGTYGEDNPCTLNFDFNPMVLLITRQGNTSQCDTRFVYPADSADDLNGQYMVVTWGEKSVSWHSWNSNSTPEYSQNNNEGQTYYWVAFGYDD